uniref:Uncharacterized protein n=1 Tax=Palpitomonas bilix TaxID=652834 RepID=A0A7S3DE44_9EUKA
MLVVFCSALIFFLPLYPSPHPPTRPNTNTASSPSLQSSSPFSPVGGPQMLMMWFAAVLGLSLLLFTVTSQQAEASGSSFPFNVLPAFTAIGVFVVAMFGAFKVGSLFVDKPHLS